MNTGFFGLPRIITDLPYADTVSASQSSATRMVARFFVRAISPTHVCTHVRLFASVVACYPGCRMIERQGGGGSRLDL